MKRFFAFLLALFTVSAVSASAGAKTLIRTGDWLLAAYDDALEIDSYTGSDPEVTLIHTFGGLPVVAVGENAFLNNASVRIIRTDETLTTIRDHGFNGCAALTKVILTASLTELGAGAFANTPALQTINLADTSAAAIPAYCFAASGLSAVVLPDSCTSIGSYAFQNCTSLTVITIPDSVTEIAENAFDACDHLAICASLDSYAAQYAEDNGIPLIQSGQTVTFIRGDADGDGSITIMDATKIQRLLAKFEEDTDGMIVLRATLSDEGFGIMDATRIQRYIALYDDPYRIGESETVVLPAEDTIV
jgi:hypothetical protein